MRKQQVAITYFDDNDLAFLQFCDSTDLQKIISILIKDEFYNKVTGELSTDKDYLNCNGDYRIIWEKIAGEIQLYGGDTIANTWRRHGVSYREILKDVCDEMSVDFQKSKSTLDNEYNFISSIFNTTLEEMHEEDQNKFWEILNNSGKYNYEDFYKNKNFNTFYSSSFLLYYLFNNQFSINKFSLIRKNKNLNIIKLLLKIMLPESKLLQLTGPAYRFTIPVCMAISHLRQKQLNRDFI